MLALLGAGATDAAAARTKLELRFRVPGAGRYALLRAVVPLTLRPGARFPARSVRLSASSVGLPKGLVVIAHAYFAHVAAHRSRGTLVADAAVFNPIARPAGAAGPRAQARATADGMVGLSIEPFGYSPFGPAQLDPPALELEEPSASSCPAVAQTFSPPFLLWRYGFTFLLPGKECPDYATEA